MAEVERLTVIVATRGRPELLTRTIESLAENTVNGDTRILVAVDDDDPRTIEAAKGWSDPVIVSIKAREDTRGPKYDRALIEAPADVYMPMSDYTPVNRHGFDDAILDAARLFEDGIGCVNTPLANASFPGIQAPTARLVDLLGYVYPPHFPFWFIDHWLDDIARMIGRYATVDIGSDHHSLAGQRKTIGLRDLAFWTGYFDALGPERRTQANRVIDAMDETPATKRRLRMNMPMIEHRSLWLNALVREMGIPETGEADERYCRVKALADRHLEALCR